MTKRDEIREDIGNKILNAFGNIKRSRELAGEIIQYLHSQGCVLKVERELPKFECALKCLSETANHSGNQKIREWYQGSIQDYKEGQHDMEEAGYVATEPLINRGSFAKKED